MQIITTAKLNAVVPIDDITASDFYINRELSLLAFNKRVLHQAKDSRVPLLERLRFLGIFAANLDEFFEIRVAGLKHQMIYGATNACSDGLSVAEQLELITQEVRTLVDEQYSILNDKLIPALRQENIVFLRRSEWSDEQRAWIKNFFLQELLPVLSPVGLDVAHPFPKVLNKSLNFIVTLSGKDAFGRSSSQAIVRAPRSLPRVINVPAECKKHEYEFVFLSSIIHAHVSDLFPGMEIMGCYQFRCTRNSDSLVETEVDDLVDALAGELSARRFGDAVRLEVANDCPEPLKEFLRSQFMLEPADVYACDGPVNLKRLMKVPDEILRPDLKYKPLVPKLPAALVDNNDIFAAMKLNDILLHHPFQPFTPVVDFLQQASQDPKVLAIRQTLYRTGIDSAVVKALVNAAERGKEVTVVVELRARFDEAANISLANILQASGVHVVYGVVGYKTHAKMIMVVRRENNRLRRYVHLGTGNYHSGTARQYTDCSLLTCDGKIGQDVQKIFQQLMAPTRVRNLQKILQAPFRLHKSLVNYIKRETDNAKLGKPARIIAKLNALSEAKIIRKLYRASQAGVKIDLIVRGICTLRPGILGLSENICVRSIVGRFLEHSRILYFENGGDYEIFLASADWMPRNFFSRIETCAPLQDESIKRTVLRDGLLNYLSDNSQAWELQSDGHYIKLSSGADERHSAQESLL